MAVRTSLKGSSAPLRAIIACGGGASAVAFATMDVGGFGGGADITTGGAAAAPSLPDSTATTAPTGATSPALTRISASTPAAVDGTSIDTLSVSISNRLSPGFTASPADLNHFVILPSATVSPSCGIRMSTRPPLTFLNRHGRACPDHPRLALSSPHHRNILRLEIFHHAFVRALTAEP